MDSFLFNYLTLGRPLGYALVFIGMILEGDIVLFIAAFLTHQGFFDIGDMSVVVFSGVFLGDWLWFCLGTRLNNASSFFKRWFERFIKPFENHLSENPIRTIFISKFIYGFNRAVIMRAGALGVKWKDFAKSDYPAAVLWIFVISFLGYISSASLIYIKHYLRFAEIALGLIFASFFLFEYLFHGFKKKL